MNRRGSQAVEFALVLPILVSLVSGVIDLGTYLSRTDALIQAAADGARAGAADGDDPTGTAKSVAEEAWASTGLPGTPTFETTEVGSAPLRMVRVAVNMPFEPWFGLVPTPSNVDYACAFLLEDQPDP